MILSLKQSLSRKILASGVFVKVQVTTNLPAARLASDRQAGILGFGICLVCVSCILEFFLNAFQTM
jgi:hypothetical protein